MILLPVLENLILQFVFGDYIRLSNQPILYTYDTLFCEIVRNSIHFEVFRLDMPLKNCLEIYVGNPFRSDQAFFPISEICNSSIFNSVIPRALCCLRTSVVRGLNTYPKILIRRGIKLDLGLRYWNEFLSYFQENSVLLKHSSYICLCRRERLVVGIFLRSIQLSSFLPSMQYLF